MTTLLHKQVYFQFGSLYTFGVVCMVLGLWIDNCILSSIIEIL